MTASRSRVRRFLWFAVVAALLLFGGRRLLTAGDGLEARYFESTTPQGTPLKVTVDGSPSGDAVRGDWRTARPDRFSVTWSGFLTVTDRGTYRFATTSDDGSQLFIDDALVVDNSGPHSVRTRVGAVRLTRGPHRVRLLFTKRRRRLLVRLVVGERER